MSKPPKDPFEDGDRTVYQPKGAVPPPPPPAAAPPPASPSAAAPVPPPPVPPPPVPPRAPSQQLPDGEVLNGIYRITRFLAKGGMGEVYEAVNVHQPSERVAIKVMLQHLAQDELVAAMFGKEAETLTRLHHEAIVQYRLSARDSAGRPYIVTEFIDGPNLEDRLGQLKLTDAQFLAIAQKLAAGLGTAHTLGAIHRDIAPDNILMAGGDPGRPKIIDFGIAKDAREQSGTIVGDGFAGKLRYVAPEQLGEYGRKIGPWTDIYSLALTLRAVVAGKHSDMGGSMADAVRKRMVVPDLSDIPLPFRQAFTAALQPDPARRPQTMAEFNIMLTSGGAVGGVGAGSAPRDAGDSGIGASGAGHTTQLTPPGKLAGSGFVAGLLAQLPKGAGTNRLPLLIGGGAAALVGGVALVIALSLGGSDDAPEAAASPTDIASAAAPAAATAQLAPGSPEFAALVQSTSAGIPCAWLSLSGTGEGAASFTGAAAVPAEAQTALAKAFGAKGAAVPTLDFANVLSFPQTTCAIIDALRETRGGAVRITTPQSNYEVRNEAIETNEGVWEAKPRAKVLVQITNPAPRKTSLIFVYDSVAPELMDSTATLGLVELFKGTATGDGMSFVLPYTPGQNRPENVGVVVISSDAPLPANIGTFDAGWPQRFRDGAKANGWQVDAVWFRVEDRQPG